MSVPSVLVGAWRRTGLFIDDERQVDHCDVIWLQTPQWFADIRLRIDPSSTPPSDGVGAMFAGALAFAGIGIWAAPLMTWQHRFDTRDELPLDANPLSPSDGVMVERGTVFHDGRDVPFVEEWLRMTGDDPPWSFNEVPGGVRVEVARWAVEIAEIRPGGPSRATRFDRAGAEWVATGSVGGGSVGGGWVGGSA